MPVHSAGTMSRSSKVPGARLGTRWRPFLTASGVGTRSPTWTIAVLWRKKKKPWTCTPSNTRYPITAEWAGEAGEADGKLPERNLNSGRQALSQGHNHYSTHTYTHTFSCKCGGVSEHCVCIANRTVLFRWLIEYFCLLSFYKNAWVPNTDSTVFDDHTIEILLCILHIVLLQGYL